jgi:putative nucleotidyltransferase with HDIG domain
MAQALDARDPYTAGHSVRVAAYSRAIALELGVRERDANTIYVGAQLHDIGKIGIPDRILQKPGKLTAEEFALVKLHPQIGRKILEKVGLFQNLLSIVELHHEQPDGWGYPYKLSANQIPLAARIVHVADAFDAMTTDRSYREARTVRAALDEIQLHAGTQFDGVAAHAFAKLILDGKQNNILLAGACPLVRPVAVEAAPAFGLAESFSYAR